MATNDDMQKQVSDAISKAIVSVVEAIAGAAGAAAGANQQTTGSQSTVGGAAGEAGQSSQATYTQSGHKNDVSVPEVLESLNVHALKDSVLVNKALVGQAQSNAKLYDVTATALGLATLFASSNNSVNMQMQSDHRDQNHTKQALATTFPFVVSGDAAEESADDSDRK